MKKGDLLFVYGTLRRGERADLTNQFRGVVNEHVGPARANGLIYHLGGFPGVKLVGKGASGRRFNKDAPVVHGDVFRLSSDVICHALDSYEGYPNLYNRVQVPLDTGETAWMYVYNHEVEQSQLIASGDWKARVQRTNGRKEAA